MTHRFFCDDLSGDNATLAGSEAHHALHVLRLKSGDPVILFNGCGITAEGSISRPSRSEATVEVTARITHERPPGTRLTVAAAVPKGDRLKSLVEKLAEIGVDRFIPLQTVRSVVDPRQTKLDKLQSTVIAACRQSERNWLMTIAEPLTLDTVLAEAPSRSEAGGDRRIWIAHPAPQARDAAPSRNTAESLLLIGPEGGFTDAEFATATQAGADQLSWPGGILRIETAAIVFASLLLANTE